MEKKGRLILLFLLSLLLILEVFTVIMPDDQLSYSAAECKLSPQNSLINQSIVISRFNSIKGLSYDESNMNCKNKSELFADYLKSIGATDIYIVTITHCSGDYSHEFVEWNGLYYDPCYSDKSYEMSKEAYLKKLKGMGFTGIIVTSPYQ